MDTTTVLEIIKKLDSHIKVIAEEYKDVDTDPDQNIPMDPSYWITVGKEMALTDHSLKVSLMQKRTRQ